MGLYVYLLPPLYQSGITFRKHNIFIPLATRCAVHSDALSLRKQVNPAETNIAVNQTKLAIIGQIITFSRSRIFFLSSHKQVLIVCRDSLRKYVILWSCITQSLYYSNLSVCTCDNDIKTTVEPEVINQLYYDSYFSRVLIFLVV